MKGHEKKGRRGGVRRFGSLLCICLALALLSGCSGAGFQTTRWQEVELPEPEMDGLVVTESDSVPVRQLDVELYFRSTDGAMLVPERARLNVAYTDDDAQAVMQLMVAAVGGDEWVNPIPEGTRLLGVEHTDRVVTVNLSIDALNVTSAQDLLWMDVAITSTLCGLPDVDCVNLLIGGRKYSLDGLSMGALTADTADAALLWARTRTELEYIEAADSTYVLERTALVYYPAENGDNFLPVAVPVRFMGADASWQLIEMLCTVPEGAQGVLPAFAFSPEHATRTIVTEDGRRVLVVEFTEDTWAQMNATGHADRSCGALALTLLSFVPELDGVSFYAGEQRVDFLGQADEAIRMENGVIARDALSSRVGAAVELCFGSADGNGLTEVTRVLSPMVERYPRMMLSLLFQGPLSGEDARSVIPVGVTTEDVLGISLVDGTMVVNLSANFYRLCQMLDADAERQLVYSIVNTLCSMADVKAVQFFVAGERAEVLSEAIYIRAPLMANPGLAQGRNE